MVKRKSAKTNNKKVAKRAGAKKSGRASASRKKSGASKKFAAAKKKAVAYAKKKAAAVKKKAALAKKKAARVKKKTLALAKKKKASAKKRAGSKKTAARRKSTAQNGKTRRLAAKTKYGSQAQTSVEKEVHDYKRGQAHSGRSKRPVRSRKQAIAIGLSKARKKGIRVPKRAAA